MPQPESQHHVPTTEMLRDLLTIEPEAMMIKPHCTLAACTIVDIPQKKHLFIQARCLFDLQISQAKCIVGALCETFPDILRPVDFNDLNVFPVGIAKVDSSASNLSAHFRSKVFTALHKLAIDRHLQTSPHTVIQTDYCSRLAPD